MLNTVRRALALGRRGMAHPSVRVPGCEIEGEVVAHAQESGGRWPIFNRQASLGPISSALASAIGSGLAFTRLSPNVLLTAT
jgi:hypothetical protein